VQLQLLEGLNNYVEIVGAEGSDGGVSLLQFSLCSDEKV
jgi:hypothetical protein